MLRCFWLNDVEAGPRTDLCPFLLRLRHIFTSFCSALFVMHGKPWIQSARLCNELRISCFKVIKIDITVKITETQPPTPDWIVASCVSDVSFA